MTNLRQPVRALIASAAILLLYMALTFSVLVGANGTISTQAAAPIAMQQANAQVAPNGTTAGKTEALSEPREKSILDADMLNSPVSYLRDAFLQETEDNAETPFRSGVVIMTLKALVASLLSTII